MLSRQLRSGIAGAWREGRLGSIMGVYWTLIAVVGFPIVETISSGMAPLRLLPMFAGVLLFLGMACWMLLRQITPVEPVPRARWIGLGVLAAIALVLNLLDAPRWHWFGLFFTIATLSAWGLPPRQAIRVLAVLFVCVALLLRMGGMSLLVTAGLLTVLTLLSVQMMNRRRLEVTNIALRSAREELTRLAVAEERLRFARDLHDLLGHSLSMITLKSELAGRLATVAPEQAATEMRDVERVARRALREVREAVAGYRQPTLAAELAGARQMLAAAGITCRIEEQVGTLPVAVDATLAWAVREGVTNVIRHSHARSCTIRALRDGDTASIEVTDDGGAGHEAAPGWPDGGAGSGLPGLAERVAAREGRFAAGPAEAGGWCLWVAVPVAGGLTSPSPQPPPSPAPRLIAGALAGASEREGEPRLSEEGMSEMGRAR